MGSQGYTEAEKAYNRDYYERNKNLKGRATGSSEPPKSGSASAPKAPPSADRAAVRAAAAKRVNELKAKLSSLKQALTAARAKSKASADKAPKPGSAEAESKKKAENKKYYEENKTKLAAKAVANAKGGSSQAKKTASSSSGTRSIEELEGAIRATVDQLKVAIAKLQSL